MCFGFLDLKGFTLFKIALICCLFFFKQDSFSYIIDTEHMGPDEYKTSCKRFVDTLDYHILCNCTVSLIN